MKTVICAVFYALGAIAMCGCILEPVDLSVFAEDEKVLDVIEKSEGIVNISWDSADGLTAGNRKITGLNPGKYYMVEEWDENGNPLPPPPNSHPQFVSSSGIRNANLVGIGMVSGRELTGLTNYHNYRVKSAAALTGDVSYYYLSAGNAGQQTPVDGIITLKPPDNGDWLVFTPTLPPPAPISHYDIVEIPVSPAGPAKSIPVSNNIVTPAIKETIIDYVFYDNVVYALYFLRVVFLGEEPPPEEPGLVITIVPYVHPTEPIFTFNQNTTTYTQAQAIAGLNISITVSTAPSFNSIDGWYYSGTKISNNATLTVSNSKINSTVDLTMLGKHEFTFIGLRGTGAGAVPYNGIFTIEITP